MKRNMIVILIKTKAVTAIMEYVQSISSFKEGIKRTLA